MKLSQDTIQAENDQQIDSHRKQLDALIVSLAVKGTNADEIVEKLSSFQIAIPSWALGTGGTRFGRFPESGEPRSLEEKIEDVGLLNALNQSSGSISLHIPWDIPSDPTGIKELAQSLNIAFDAVNSNTFQDQTEQTHSYKFGSLTS
ncbi:MAG: sugar isomerase, partial [Bacteroidota bacterium]